MPMVIATHVIPSAAKNLPSSRLDVQRKPSATRMRGGLVSLAASSGCQVCPQHGSGFRRYVRVYSESARVRVRPASDVRCRNPALSSRLKRRPWPATRPPRSTRTSFSIETARSVNWRLSPNCTSDWAIPGTGSGSERLWIVAGTRRPPGAASPSTSPNA